MPADSYSTAEHGTALNNTDFQALQETAHNFSRGTQDFSTDLCDCCEGPGAASGCLLAFFFPFWAHGIIGNEVAEGVGRVPAAFPTFCVYSLNCLVASLTPLIGAYHHPFSVSLALAMLRFNWQGRRKMREKYGIPNDGNGTLLHATVCPFSIQTCFTCSTLSMASSTVGLFSAEFG